jgi:hypothetical protein
MQQRTPTLRSRPSRNHRSCKTIDRRKYANKYRRIRFAPDRGWLDANSTKARDRGCAYTYRQDLAPRAYVITPLHSNAVTLTYTYYTGGLQFDGAVPITGATANISVPILSYYHALNFFGRSANIVGTLPYGVGNLQGMVQGAEGHLYRSGLLDSVYRFSVNLKGGPAMPLEEMRRWRQKTLIGVSLRVVAPTGQYDPTKLINWGNNRWAFKPEVGYSRRRKNWLMDAYVGGWFYTTNPEFFSRNQFFPGTRT